MNLIRPSATSMTLRPALVGGIRRTVFVLLYGLLFLIQPSIGGAENQTTSPEVYHARLFSAVAASYHQAGHLPFPPAEILSELQTAEESNEGNNDKSTRLHTELSVNRSLNFHSDKLLFDHLKCSDENRSSISLFILYHSWKSFPY